MELWGAKWTDVGLFIATTIGFIGVFAQIQLLRKATAGETHGDLYGEYIEIGKLFLEKPYLRRYFYNSISVDATEADPTSSKAITLRAEVDTMCELLASLLEHAWLQRKDLPRNSFKQCWRAYVDDRFKRSQELRNYWTENSDIYASSFGIYVKKLFIKEKWPLGKLANGPQPRRWIVMIWSFFRKLCQRLERPG